MQQARDRLADAEAILGTAHPAVVVSAATDQEAEATAVERIKSGASDHKEDGAEALERLGIEVPPAAHKANQAARIVGEQISLTR